MNLDRVEEIVSLLSKYPVSEISYEQDGMKIVARKAVAAFLSSDMEDERQDVPRETSDSSEALGSVKPAEEESLASQPGAITAGLVGLFRHTEPPIGYGYRITSGEIVGSIEAMKVLNDVRADVSGQVVDVLAEEGAPVEYGQVLFRLISDKDIGE